MMLTLNPNLYYILLRKLVERRYRDKVRARLDILYSKVPALESSYPCTLEVEQSPRTLNGSPKAVVIAEAVRYTEQRLRRPTTRVHAAAGGNSSCLRVG